MTEDDLVQALIDALTGTKKKKTPDEVTVAVEQIARMSEEFLSLVGRQYMRRGFGEEILYDIILAGIAISIRRSSGAPLAWEDFKKVEDHLFNTSDPNDVKRMQDEVAKSVSDSILCDDPTCEACNMVRKLASEGKDTQMNFPFFSTTKH